MTNEEAIASLKKLKSFHNGSYGSAIAVAIEALEKLEMYEPKLKYGYYSLPMPSLCEVCGAKECMFKSEYVSSCPEAHFKKGNLND